MSALMQLKKRLHLNVKVRRPTNPDLKMKRAGSRKKGRWRKLSAYISYVTKAMVSQSSFFYYVRNIVNDISEITRKSTDKNLMGEADFLITRKLFILKGR